LPGSSGLCGWIRSCIFSRTACKRSRLDQPWRVDVRTISAICVTAVSSRNISSRPSLLLGKSLLNGLVQSFDCKRRIPSVAFAQDHSAWIAMADDVCGNAGAGFLLQRNLRRIDFCRTLPLYTDPAHRRACSNPTFEMDVPACGDCATDPDCGVFDRDDCTQPRLAE